MQGSVCNSILFRLQDSSHVLTSFAPFLKNSQDVRDILHVSFLYIEATLEEFLAGARTTFAHDASKEPGHLFLHMGQQITKKIDINRRLHGSLHELLSNVQRGVGVGSGSSNVTPV